MRILVALLLTASVVGLAFANSVKLPIFGATVAQSSTQPPCCGYPAGFPATNGIDGSLLTFTHTNDANPAWQILLANPVAIDRVVVTGRWDCCRSRDRDIVVEVISGATAASLATFTMGSGGKVEYVSPPYNPDNIFNYGVEGGVLNMVFQLPNVTLANFVRVMRRSTDPDRFVLSFAEFSIFGFQPDLAPVPTSGANAVQTSEWNGGQFPASNAKNNGLGDFTHTSGDFVNDRSPGWQMILPQGEIIQRIVLWNRVDCCRHRLSDITLELVSGATSASLGNFALGTGGTVVYTSPVLNPGNIMASPTFIDVYLPAPVTANFVRVRKINSMVGGDMEKATLSLAEVQLFGLSKETEFCGSQYGNCALYCIGVGERSGCSGCAGTNGTCTWCADPDNEAVGTCVLAGKGTTCGTSKLSTRISRWKPSNSKCPVDMTKEAPLKGKNLPSSHKEASFSFGFASHFCEFPHEPYFVDKWSGANGLTAYTQSDSTPCQTANTHFGTFPGATTKEEFLELVNDACLSDENPLDTHYGRECMRLMQNAYCSSACPAYGVPAARPCFNWENLFRVCAPWTNKAERLSFDVAPVNNGCPLDPNNIPKASVIEAKCDPNQRLVTASGLWEHTFGLYEPFPDPSSKE